MEKLCLKQPDLIERINKQKKIFLPTAMECCGKVIDISTSSKEVRLFTRTGVQSGILFHGKYINWKKILGFFFELSFELPNCHLMKIDKCKEFCVKCLCQDSPRHL